MWLWSGLGLLLAWSLPSAGAPMLTLRGGDLEVGLDPLLPRPLLVRHLRTGRDFSPPAAAGSSVSPQGWWKSLAGWALLTAAGD